MNVLCIRVPTISREWARKFKKVIFVNHDVTAYFANISSSSSYSFLKLSRLATSLLNVGLSLGSISQQLLITCTRYLRMLFGSANLDNSVKLLPVHFQVRDVVRFTTSQNVHWKWFVPCVRVSPANKLFSQIQF